MSQISTVNFMVKSCETGRVETVHVNRLKEFNKNEWTDDDVADIFGNSDS